MALVVSATAIPDGLLALAVQPAPLVLLASSRITTETAQCANLDVTSVNPGLEPAPNAVPVSLQMPTIELNALLLPLLELEVFRVLMDPSLLVPLLLVKCKF